MENKYNLYYTTVSRITVCPYSNLSPPRADNDERYFQRVLQPRGIVVHLVSIGSPRFSHFYHVQILVDR